MFATLVKGRRKLDRRININGLRVSIETDRGNVRSGKDRDGKDWRTVMPHPYGYIRGTKGVDGDHLDVTLGPDKDAKKVWVIHIKRPHDGKYDEDKAYMNFATREQVIAAFRKQYDNPDKFMGPVSEYSLDEFKDLIRDTRKNPRRLGRGKAVKGFATFRR